MPGSRKGSKSSRKQEVANMAEESAMVSAEDIANEAARDADGNSIAKKGKPVIQVPYGNPYSPEQQAKNVADKVRTGIQDIMNLVRNGAEACVDRAAVVEAASSLEQQADKIVAAIAKDTVYVEEVRHHHNRISDLCDDTRAYTHEQMVADLKRAAAIRVNVMTIVQGKAPEFELEQEELDELKSVRLMLRRKFGAKDRDSGDNKGGIAGPVDQSAMLGAPSEVKAQVPPKIDFGGMASEGIVEGMLRSTAATPGSWADNVVAGNVESVSSRMDTMPGQV